MAMFVGEFPQTLDSQHRLTIPAGLREGAKPAKDGKGYYLVLAPDLHLWLYPDIAYGQRLAAMRSSPLPNMATQDVRFFSALSRHVKPDKQGRIVVPEQCLQRANISREVMLVGGIDHIEIWPADEWQRYVEATMPSYPRMMEQANQRWWAESQSLGQKDKPPKGQSQNT